MKIHPLLKIGVPIIFVVYLILYILLTPNGSRQISDAFVVVNDNVVLADKNLSQRLQDIYRGFAIEHESDPGKVNPDWEKAKQARRLSNDLLNYLEQVKNQVIARTEHIPLDSAKVIPLRSLKSGDDYETPTRFFLGNQDDGRSGVAIKLKTKIEDFRNKMRELADKSKLKDIDSLLSTNGPYFNTDGRKQNWQRHFFYHTGLVADITLLNIIKSAVYNAEYEVVNNLYKTVGKESFKFDKIQARVLPTSNFVILGDEYKAQVFVEAYDKSQSLKVYLMNGVDYLPADKFKEATELNGKPGNIMIRFPARKMGMNKYAGFVRERTSKGQINDYHFSGTYTVYKPLLTVSATKMNIFYIGLSNPVSIAISGIPTQDVFPTISCGTIQRNPEGNNWLVNIPPGNKLALIQVYANVDGERRQLGSQMFRVKKLPSPFATIGGMSSGGIDSKILLAAGVLSLQMPDDFDFDETFTISSFTMTIQRGFQVYHFKSNNAYLTQEMRDQIERMNPGQNVVFENIIARDPTGLNRKLAPIILTIN
ncbi:MAG: hypothetical protein IH595_11175 [Bacteroidales bacterium]|nr:hypothetical protein [Bacteroidales bacterium]